MYRTMYRVVLGVAALSAAACSARPSRAPAPRPAAAAASLYGRVPDRVGDFSLTERSAVAGLPADSVFRFSDGSPTRLTVFVYDVDEEVKVEPDSQRWTAREGEKFRIVQDVRRSRGQLASYVVAFSDTARVAAGGRQILEHSIAVPVRFPNGAIAVDLQYLYLIGGRFLKVRATVPEPGWQQTTVPQFARELARRLSGGAGAATRRR